MDGFARFITAWLCFFIPKLEASATFYKLKLQLLRTSHAVSAVEAAVAGSVSDADAAADVTGGGVVLEVVELFVKLSHGRGLRPIRVADNTGDHFNRSIRDPAETVARRRSGWGRSPGRAASRARLQT